MSEYLFGPSAEWLPSTMLEGESIQPRLDGGYNYPTIRRFGSFVLREAIAKRIDPNQPTLFEQDNTEIVTSPTLFENEENEY